MNDILTQEFQCVSRLKLELFLTHQILRPLSIFARFPSSCKNAVVEEIEWLEQAGKLSAPLATKLKKGFGAAGQACLEDAQYNTAGKLPRSVLKLNSVTLDNVRTLLDMMKSCPVNDDKSNDLFNLYGIVHKVSRKAPFAAFDDGHVALKFGDTKLKGVFTQNGVTTSPAEQRYEAPVYKSVEAEFFLTCRATRALRVVTELYVSWMASESVSPLFKTDTKTGDEGFYGQASLAQAKAALETVREKLYTDDLLKKIFDKSRGFRLGGGNWDLELK